MTREEFLTRFQNILQSEFPISSEMKLYELTDWDSLAQVSTLAFLTTDFGVTVTLTEFGNLETVDDLLKFAGL